MSCSVRCPWGLLVWTLLLAVLSSGLLSPSSADVDGVDCEKHTNCSTCVEVNCTWLLCKEGNQSHCVNDSSQPPKCTVLSYQNVTCSDFSTTTTVSIISISTGSSAATTNSSSTVRPTTSSNTSVIITTAGTNPTTGTSPEPTVKPSPHKSTFDAASFIGGIVLVLGLQAVIFFLYKFCKSKEQNYHTL